MGPTIARVLSPGGSRGSAGPRSQGSAVPSVAGEPHPSRDENPCVLIPRRVLRSVAGFRHPLQKLHINLPAGLISWMAMPRSLRPEPGASAVRSPRDEEGHLSSTATLATEGTVPPRSPSTRRSSYRPPSFWTRVRLRADPRGWTAAWRVSRLYHHLKPFDKLAYLKHYEGEPASASATTGLKLVSRAERARRGR